MLCEGRGKKGETVKFLLLAANHPKYIHFSLLSDDVSSVMDFIQTHHNNVIAETETLVSSSLIYLTLVNMFVVLVYQMPPHAPLRCYKSNLQPIDQQARM